MVSFNCTRCQDVVKKPKVPSHAASCGVQTFSCVDCMKMFDLESIKNHTSCVSEVQKYQGKWKGPANKNYGPDSDDEDPEMKKKHEITKALHQERRRPRQMNFDDTDMSSSDDDNDKKKKKPAAAPAAVAAKKATKKKDSDSDEEEQAAAPKAPKNSADASKNKKKSASPARKASPKLSPVAKPAAAVATATTTGSSSSVNCTFPVASSSSEFKSMVSSILSEYEGGVSAKAAAKLVYEKMIATSSTQKAMKSAIQNLITENCKVNKDGHVVA